jgi:hypothetical protein
MSAISRRLPRNLATSGLILSIAIVAAACSAAASPSASSAPSSSSEPTTVASAPATSSEPTTGSSSAPAGTVCDDVTALEASVEALGHVDLQTGGTDALTAAIGDVKTSAEALKASASTELASSVDAMTSKLDALQTAVTQLGQDGSPAGLLAVGTAVKDLLAAAQDLETQFKNACP